MTKRLLIDASHAEETRVVVLDGNRLEDFDIETLSRRQLKGNIYLAKVVRVEPSLQAAFVEYGGNRHGFLAFGEIHPDYYQIPVADRQRLLALQEEEAHAQEQAEDDYFSDPKASDGTIEGEGEAEPADPYPAGQDPEAEAQPLALTSETLLGETEPEQAHQALSFLEDVAEATPLPADENAEIEQSRGEQAEFGGDTVPGTGEPGLDPESVEQDAPAPPDTDSSQDQPGSLSRVSRIGNGEDPLPQTVGGETETSDDGRATRRESRFIRSYKIQEVIRRRQILLVQVIKEERGTKGAALTTYISLAGRYCVLMPNSPRGGGISRKITSVTDRRRLKEVTAELDIPRGMGLIVRTAGAARPKPEIKRDGEYLLRLWDDIREQTMRSMAPSLIHEEASLIKRAIRDVYSRDVDELLVDGEDGWRAARDYMRMLMPTHVKKVQLWPGNAQPLFAHSQVESLLDAMLSPTVQLRSGGYLVINQTEALVAIDVNSGRSTRERGIEETALRTNLEAAEEAARQLRLRDLAGLIVIDFIDMESKKHVSMVERRMADALKIDRARIQIGHISHFGLLELSRQRLRPSLAETSLNVCAACGGSGHVRSTESASLHVLREVEEEGGRRRAAEILVHVAADTALYILNNKRQRLTEIEIRYGMKVCFASDPTLLAAQTRIEKLRAAIPQELPALAPAQAQPMPADDADEADIADDEADVIMPQSSGQETDTAANVTSPGDYATDADHVPGETAAEGEQRRRRRRRRRRGGGRREDGALPESAPPLLDGADQPDIPDLQTPPSSPYRQADHSSAPMAQDALAPANAGEAMANVPPDGIGEGQATTETPHQDGSATEEEARFKRGRRGGRRRRKPDQDGAAPAIAEPPPFPAYVGPTPADPFSLAGLDIFEALEQAEMMSGTRVVAEAPQPPEEPAPDQPASATAEAALPSTDMQVVAEAPQPPPPPPYEMDRPQEPHQPVDLPLSTLSSTPVSAPAPAEPKGEPAIQPVLIGAGQNTTAAPKKGWWRR